ncbi:hypothetical protein DPMN_011939 [Dreissena polymorpha]|uniref:Uncharacterized protein n=1 Tax=Dreissena polymorpha TaxID=45954 RepID=A0A9D4N1H1_DREPO|nr:hypothetical protein DPMN_011939 [Dreissena polymorpha]
MMFADDAALSTQKAFQKLIDLFAKAYTNFRLYFSMKVTNIVDQDACNITCSKIGDYTHKLGLFLP